jgi:Spy/CpxP family protein refolding chaperone
MELNKIILGPIVNWKSVNRMNEAKKLRRVELKKNVIILISAIALTLVTVDIVAQPGGMRYYRQGMMGRGGAMCYGNIDTMKEVLNLSDGQIERISRINSEFGDALFRLYEKMRPLQTRLRELLLNDINNLNGLRAVLTRISEVEVDIRMTRIRQMIAIEKVLTRAQRDRLRQERRITNAD